MFREFFTLEFKILFLSYSDLQFSMLMDSHISAFNNFNIAWDKICDNRDIDILISNNYKLQPYTTNIAKQKTLNQEILLLKYRYLLLKLLILGNTLTRKFCSEENNSEDNSNLNDNENFSIENFDSLLEELKQLIKNCESEILSADISVGVFFQRFGVFNF